MSSESKALKRLKIAERIIKDRKRINPEELEAMLMYQFGVLPRTVAKYLDCLVTLNLVTLKDGHWEPVA